MPPALSTSTDGTPSDPRAFTLHRECGWGSAALGLSLAIVAEALPMHLLVARHHPRIAWTLTLLSLGGLFWLFGDFRAMSLRPVRFGADALELHVGRRWSARVPFDRIAAIRTVRGTPPPRREAGTLRAVVLGDPSFLLDLREPVVAHGPYGLTREVRRIAIAPDDRARFLELLAASAPAAVRA